MLHSLGDCLVEPTLQAGLGSDSEKYRALWVLLTLQSALPVNFPEWIRRPGRPEMLRGFMLSVLKMQWVLVKVLTRLLAAFALFLVSVPLSELGTAGRGFWSCGYLLCNGVEAHRSYFGIGHWPQFFR